MLVFAKKGNMAGYKCSKGKPYTGPLAGSQYRKLLLHGFLIDVEPTPEPPASQPDETATKSTRKGK